jgi:hypothetical protein
MFCVIHSCRSSSRSHTVPPTSLGA